MLKFSKLCVVALAIFMLASGSASAADRYWVGLTGFWDETARWSTTSGGAGGAGMPGNGDNAFIISSTSLTVTRDSVTPNYSAPGPALVRLAGTGGAVVTLRQITGNNMAATELDVGSLGTAQYVQTSGLNTVNTLQ